LNALEEGTLFLFCGINRSVIKGLLFEGDGYLILTKRLSCGFYRWPRDSTEARQIDQNAFQRLMDGFQVDSSIRRTERIHQSV
jgi:transposase